MYEDHLRTCEYCQKAGRTRSAGQTHKPTIRIKSASSYHKERKLTELGAIIRGTSYPPISIPVSRTKGASDLTSKPRPGPIEREVKLKQLGKLVRG